MFIFSFKPLTWLLKCQASPLTNQNFGSWVVDTDSFQDGCTIIGHSHCATLPATKQDLILKRKRNPQIITYSCVSLD